MSDDKTHSLILHHFLPYRMVNLAKRISDCCSTVYIEEFGLSIPEWRVLARLGEQAGLNAKDLGEIACMDKSKVSRAVKQLDEKGYLVKKKDQNDNRVCYLSLSKSGYNLYRELAPKALDWEAGLLQALSASEYRDLLRVMEKLEVRLTDMENK